MVVYGAWQGGWGDEGRVQWMLKSLGHKNAFILSGGLAAYVEKYSPTLSTNVTAVATVPADVSVWSSGLDMTGFEDIVETKAGIKATDLLVDTRTQAEYDGTKSGADNYGVLRDGHATGAMLYSFPDYFVGSCLKTCNAFKADLSTRGWTEGQALVSYCTAGIRSAFFWSFASHCGIAQVSNYGGSMWEYAADSALPMTTGISPGCTNEINTVADFYVKKSSFDLIVDVRTLSEYTGDGDTACNAGKANKCNMGHDPDMWMLVNEARTDKAVLYKVDGKHTVDPVIVQSLKDCYGEQAKTMKIAVSCHSGSRSYAMQMALVSAGFTCGNMYNVRPGADGLWKADPSKLVKGNTAKGPWSCNAAPANSMSTSSAVSFKLLPCSLLFLVLAHVWMRM